MAEKKTLSVADLEANNEAYKVAMMSYIVSRRLLPFSDEKSTPAFYGDSYQFIHSFSAISPLVWRG